MTLHSRHPSTRSRAERRGVVPLLQTADDAVVVEADRDQTQGGDGRPCRNRPHHGVVGAGHLLDPRELLEVLPYRLLAELVQVDVAHHRLQAVVLDDLEGLTVQPVLARQVGGLRARSLRRTCTDRERS